MAASSSARVSLKTSANSCSPLFLLDTINNAKHGGEVKQLKSVLQQLKSNVQGAFVGLTHTHPLTLNKFFTHECHATLTPFHLLFQFSVIDQKEWKRLAVYCAEAAIEVLHLN